VQIPNYRKSFPGSPLAVAYGGGVNSVAVLVLLAVSRQRPDYIVFADTGCEHPRTYEHIKTVISPWLRQLSYPAITVVRGRKKNRHSLYSYCFSQTLLPSIAFGSRSCTDHWKVRPQRRWLKDQPPVQLAWQEGKPLVTLIGFAADETHRIKRPRSRRHAYAYPLADVNWSRQHCINAILEYGLPVPVPSRCYFCPATPRADVRQLARDYPYLYRRAVKLEDHVIASGRLKKLRGLGGRWSWRTVHDDPPPPQELA